MPQPHLIIKLPPFPPPFLRDALAAAFSRAPAISSCTSQQQQQSCVVVDDDIVDLFNFSTFQCFSNFHCRSHLDEFGRLVKDPIIETVSKTVEINSLSPSCSAKVTCQPPPPHVRGPGSQESIIIIYRRHRIAPQVLLICFKAIAVISSIHRIRVAGLIINGAR